MSFFPLQNRLAQNSSRQHWWAFLHFRIGCCQHWWENWSYSPRLFCASSQGTECPDRLLNARMFILRGKLLCQDIGIKFCFLKKSYKRSIVINSVFYIKFLSLCVSLIASFMCFSLIFSICSVGTPMNRCISSEFVFSSICCLLVPAWAVCIRYGIDLSPYFGQRINLLSYIILLVIEIDSLVWKESIKGHVQLHVLDTQVMSSSQMHMKSLALRVLRFIRACWFIFSWVHNTR